MSATNNDAKNQAIADQFGIPLLQAEVFFAIIDVAGMAIEGHLCYHGEVPSVSILKMLVEMKAAGFKLTEDRFHNHVRIMNAHGLVHNTAEGQKAGTEYLAKHGTPGAQPAPKQLKDPHNRLEDN